MNRRGIEFHLTDEITIEILSRLPAKDVLRSRSVCKRWRDLTCTHYFTRLHMERCLPMLLRMNSWQRYDAKMLDQWWEQPQFAPKTYKKGNYYDHGDLFSSGGLVVTQKPDALYYRIFNPIYHERVKITLSQELRDSEIYGVFFHPSIKEYCTLWRIPVSGEFSKPLIEKKRYEYKILTLGSEPCWRDINNSWSHGASTPPVLIGEHLYCVVKHEPVTYKRIQMNKLRSVYSSVFSADIMEFDTRKEEFTFIPSPIPGALECYGYNTNLLDIGGLLSLVQVSGEGYPSIQAVEVNIWTLNDRARQLWTRSSYSFNRGPCSMLGSPIAIANDKLIVNTCDELVIYNLKLRTVRELGSYCNSAFKTHLMSVISLRNCKRQICMDKRGEVGKNRKRRR